MTAAWEGRWNLTVIIVGLPGDGKTTVVKRIIANHLRTTPGIVLAHDPLAQFTSVGCRHYASVAAYRAAAAAAARDKAPMPRGAAIGGDTSDDVTELAMELGERLNTADRVRVPILVPYDEGSLREGSGSTWMGKVDRRFLALRRHRGVGPVFNVQDVAMLTQGFYRMATDVVLFQLPSDRARDLDEKLYLERGTLERAGVTRLPHHYYLRVRPRVGVVAEAF